eukprot:TRINITY_DN24135_c0_g1_i1.p1 TRINITY_DN24135_c0_g1~~TRINITY_DN24135_c0_g1_i1.p1  ORF type:complete len:491 (-),score=94.91 TRINITY_DN24135_c0_g1_i1:5-1477(-)
MDPSQMQQFMDPAQMASLAQLQAAAASSTALASSTQFANAAQVPGSMMDPSVMYQQMLMMQAQQAQLAQAQFTAATPADQAATLALAHQTGLLAAQAAAKAAVQPQASSAAAQASLTHAHMAAMMGGGSSTPRGHTSPGQEPPSKRPRTDVDKRRDEGKPWLCACGFQNRPTNLICGGYGDKHLGCKQPRQDLDTLSGSEKPWLCACGFQNRPSNMVCGGYGNKMGCGEPRREKDGVPLPPSNDWVCSCKFVNRERNLICGGNGSGLGCKKPKPGVLPGATFTDDAWVCKCGFQNSISNRVCGGLKGDRGCKQQRLAGATDETQINVGQRVTADLSLDWRCLLCGFQNFARNSICGGDKPGMGCKAPRSGTEPIGADIWEKSKGKGKYTEKGKGTMGKNSVLEDTSQDWDCMHCGLNNFAKNVICGGDKSALGCKAPRAMADLTMLSMLCMASMGKSKGSTGAKLPFAAGASSKGGGKFGKAKGAFHTAW